MCHPRITLWLWDGAEQTGLASGQAGQSGTSVLFETGGSCGSGRQGSASATRVPTLVRDHPSISSMAQACSLSPVAGACPGSAGYIRVLACRLPRRRAVGLVCVQGVLALQAVTSLRLSACFRRMVLRQFCSCLRRRLWQWDTNRRPT